MEDVLVEFVGGPFDGRTLSSGEDPEFDVHKAKWAVCAAASSLDDAQRREDPPGVLLVWRVQVGGREAREASETWPSAKRMALVHHHVYHVTSLRDEHGIVLMKAFYQGID